MTTRPPGAQRPVQRSLSGNNLQRPQQQNRTLSQQFPPASPIRRNNEGFVDLTLDPDAPGRYPNVQRNGGSKLRLEISKDAQNTSFVESPKPTSVATPTWKPSLPRGKPSLQFDLSVTTSRDALTVPQEGGIVAPIKRMPLPPRPVQYVPPLPEKTREAPIHIIKKDVRPRPFQMEVPALAPHYAPNGGHADFFPWTGNHPEDQFSENVIRNGYYDKTQMTQNETGTAKGSITPALKHKQILPTLSNIFTSILAQRQAHGQITSSSTFKPPPRVTVTDTKREMWLKDLANPTISLRRLSRSIPHGIRGKVLLDQSLSKNIPIERAVWLAKCVGANELRSFRRKGASGTFAMGGEAKWIRDFTVCVEQFVESIVGSSSEKDFRSRINYAIRLAAVFYAEHLLDREHYMDWLVSSLEHCVQERLPMWLLVTQIYWKDLLLYRKYGRRLSAALLYQMTEVTSHPDVDIMAPLHDRLKTLLKGIMASNPESFVNPKIWSQHSESMRASLLSQDPEFEIILDSVKRRNARFASNGPGKRITPRRLLISILDTTFTEPLTAELVNACWRVDDDKSLIVQTVLEWSTSAYRPGPAKIFIATRMLRRWSRSGIDVTEAILDFLDSVACDKGRDKAAFYHLVSELARSEHFSATLYIQWIIARGGLYDATDVTLKGPCATRLLAELPTHNLPESIIFLRTTLLDRVGFSVDEEEEQIMAHQAFVNRLLPGMHASMGLDVDLEFDEIMSEEISEFSSCLSRTIKSEIGLWIRQKVHLEVAKSTIAPVDEWIGSPIDGGSSVITAADFNVVRKYLELTDDYSILADVLKTVTSSNDPEVLASCADTLNLHSDVFAAIGALTGLFEVLVTRLSSLAENDSFPRVLLVSISDLAAIIPEQKAIGQQLAQSLARSDRKTAADACSPISDHMAGIMQTAEADFTDEMEKILASGSSMDQATMERLFQRIALRLEDSWSKSSEQYRSCGLLLTRLRTFDTSGFDLLMGTWVNRFLQMDNRPSMMQIFGPLISFGCLSLSDVVSLSTSRLSRDVSLGSQATSKMFRELLLLLAAPSNLSETMSEEDMYRLRIKQNRYQRDQVLDTLPIICRALEENIENDERGSDFGLTYLFSDLLELLQRLVLLDTDSVTQNLVGPLSQKEPAITATITQIVDKLLATESYIDGAPQMPIETVLGLADDFTLPFCQVKLASMFKSTDTSQAGLSENLQSFDKAIESAFEASNTSWACIVPLLDISISQHLRTRTESQFLALLPTPKTSMDDSSLTNGRIKQAENFLYIIEAGAESMTIPASYGSLPTDLVSAYNNCWLLLSSSTAVQNKEAKGIVIEKWLPLLLSFTIIHIPVFEATKAGHENRARLLLALSAILLELLAMPLPPEALVEQVFDLSLDIVDALPDDMRQHCIRGLRDKVSNSRMSYMFSIATNPSEWLVLEKKERIGGAAGLEKEQAVPFPLRRWEMLGEPTPNVGENDTSLSLTLFEARRG